MLLLSCDPSAPPPDPQGRAPTPDAVASFGSCAPQSVCTGVLGGAPYEIKLPAKWNGTLLLWSHGYRQSTPTPPNREVQNNPESAPSPEIGKKLLAKGYAIAGSAYARNGWAVTDGVRAGEQLHQLFVRMVGKPSRTYVWGASLGGLITQTLAEKHPDWVSGAAPVCGVLGGAKLTLDLALDATYAIKTLLYPQMKISRYSSSQEARTNFDGAFGAISAASRDRLEGVPKLMLIAALIDAPATSIDEDGHDAPSRLKATVGSLVTAALYGTVVRWDLEQRAGGNPSSNVAADYSTRVTAAEGEQPEALSRGSVARNLALLAQGQRVTADAQAREVAAGLGNPTGVLRAPTVTLHTIVDPLVIVQNESAFRSRVAAAAGRGTASLLQLYTKPPRRYATAPYGAGHCNFTSREWVGVVGVLDTMVRRGERPSNADIAAAFAGDPGLALGYVPAPWPDPSAA